MISLPSNLAVTVRGRVQSATQSPSARFIAIFSLLRGNYDDVAESRVTPEWTTVLEGAITICIIKQGTCSFGYGEVALLG
jgi:hypothetical protein